jgi:pyruvate/2-oxoacid:ferredoxin oxidoreductase beta subunit
MSLLLQKKLLALQEENAILRKQIQDLQELSDKTVNDYIRKAAIDAKVRGAHEGMSFVHSQTPGISQGLKDLFKGHSEQDKAIADKRLKGLWRALRMREHDQARNRNTNT